MRVKNTLWPRNRKGQILEGGPGRGNTSRTQPIGLLSDMRAACHVLRLSFQWLIH